MRPDVDHPTTLVTGGAGFVGRHIVASLARAGHHVVVVDRAFDPDIESFWEGHGPVRLLESDVRNLSDAICGPVQYVIHAAAVTGTPEETGSEAEVQFVEEIDGVGAVLDWARRHNVVRTVLVSSGAVLAGSGLTMGDEDSRPSPTSIYASAKLATEILGDALRRFYGLDVVAVRFGNVYGPGERARTTRPRTSLVHRMLLEGIAVQSIRAPMQGTATDWTYAADMGNAISALLFARELQHGLYHLTSEEMLTALEIAQCIALSLTENGHETVVLEVNGGDVEVRGALAGARARSELRLGEWTPFSRGIRETVATAMRTIEKEQCE